MNAVYSLLAWKEKPGALRTGTIMTLIGLLISLFLSLFAKTRHRVVFIIALGSVVYTFCMMNVNKKIEGDWLWYTTHYLLTGNFTLGEYLGAKIGWMTVKANEPVYYIIARLIYYLTSGDITYLAIFVTFINYLLIGTAIFLVGRFLSNSLLTANYSLVLVGCTIIAITFTLIAQLVRQELATSIAALGFALVLNRKLYLGSICAVVAVLTHQSSALFVWVFFLPAIMERFFGGYPKYRIVVLIGGVAVSLLAGYLIANSDISSLGSKDDGSVSIYLFIIDAIIAGVFMITTFILRSNPLRRSLAESYVLFYASFAALSVLPLAALRMYFYMDFLRSISILVLIISLIPARFSRLVQLPIGISVLALSLVYTNLRIESSPFYYGGSLGSYLIRTAPPTTVR
jgi:hypothetical protein